MFFVLDTPSNRPDECACPISMLPNPCPAQVVAYGISINLVEVTWKGKIKAQFPNPNDYSAFMGDFSSSTGAVTFLMMIASRFIFRKFGWGVAAQITPIVLLITGVPCTCPVPIMGWPPALHAQG